ncbi:MAG: hypothetical protein CMN56_01465 [Sneathiella sp.]|uniref:TRAP transporter substrate-binding protein DctP n=1 Tax=Sneathiella sp. TaxID=1964365 RepID=UPI000C4945A9|nr:TRAP transporter substrate-binding protein DctP [Sneathiella sp.]MAZ01784.1 hypothetical protein [Sneathiella sp.]
MSIRSKIAYSILAAGLVGFGSGAASAKELTFAGYTSSNHVVAQEAILPFFEDVAKRTNGSLTFRFSPVGELLKAKAIGPGVEDGLAEAGQVISLVYVNELPHYHVINQAMIYASGSLAANGAALELCYLAYPECNEDYKKRGLVHLGDYSTTNYYNFICREEVTSLDDLKGRRVRGLSTAGRWAESVGALAINMTSAEMVEALQSGGQVECATAPIAWITNYALMDTIKSVLVVERGAYPAINFMTMNRDTWNDLSTTEKQAIIDALPMGIANAAVKGYVDLDAKTRKEAEAKGTKFIKVDEEKLDALYAEFLKSEEAVLAKRFEENQIEGATEAIATFRELLIKWKGIIDNLPEITPTAYAKTLKDNVFSKIKPEDL